MSKDSMLFEQDDHNLYSKYLRLVDLLVTNKSVTRLECIILFSIFYIQILSGFFSPYIGILDSSYSNSDAILYYINMILRVKDLFIDSYSAFKIVLILLLIFLIFIVIYSYQLSKTITKLTVYSFKEMILNFMLKIFIYVLFIPILDLCFANIHFEAHNNNFPSLSATDDKNFATIIGVILFIYSCFLCFFIHVFYSDSLLLSNSFYAKMSFPYEIYLTINNIIYSLLLSQARTMGKEVFIFYNLIISLIFLKMYFDKYLFYDSVINTVVGFFHSLYAWTSVFFVIFHYFPIYDKGIIYIIGSIILVFLYLNLKFRLEEEILLYKAFHKIDNHYYLLYYLKTILDRINNIENHPGERAKLIGIIELHALECPNPDCPTKHKNEKLYLPASNEWSLRDKPEVNDKVYLINLPIFILTIFTSQENCPADVLINFSHYYLSMSKNICQSMIVFKRIKDLKLNIFEKFTFYRLENLISKQFLERLKPSTEVCTQIEDLNCSLYFKYQNLSHKFFDEINNDINLTLEFWKSFKVHCETNRPLDFNKIFSMVDKIRLSKIKIESLWNELFSTNSGVNEVFDLFLNYVEQINDDDMLKRDLDQIKNKTASSSEQINMNYYSHLFSKSTGIIIANGDKGKEGQIEKTNDDIEKIFLYKPDELKTMNVIVLMPKMFQGPHQALMERYATIGEKRLMDKNFKAFAKDKENMLIHAGLVLRQFPILTDNILYCALVIKGTIEDALYLDRQFNIQGMCRKLQQRFEIDSKVIFTVVDFPFYIMCKDFIDFYANYILPKKSNVNSNIAMIMDGDKKTEYQLIEENLDHFNDALELEFTARIPQFFLNYVNIINKRDIKIEVSINKNKQDEDESQEASTNEYDEDDALVNEGGNNNTPTDKAADLNLNKVNEDDREYLTKVHHMRTLFNSKKFEELSEMIDKLNADSPTKEHNFIFNFIVHKYGRGEKGFIIRCIDNKGDDDENESGSQGSFEGKMSGRIKLCKEAKIDSIMEIHQITPDEKQTIIKNASDFTSLNNTNREFLKKSNYLKQEITEYSKIFGFKKEDAVINDETASQNAGSGFNENLSKKQRIEEIRSNIMNNVSNFYALRWIKIIFMIMLAVTSVFSGCYLVIYTTMFNNINNLSTLNVNYFQTTIWMSNIVSSIISMRSVFELNLRNDTIQYNSYIPNANDYFEKLRGFSEMWYTNVLNRLGQIEKAMSMYYNTDSKPLWENNKISYPSNKQINNDIESFPLGISQSLSADNKLLKSDIFSITKILSGKYTAEDINRIRYSAYIGIENAINNIIPSQIKLLNKISTDFPVFNSKNISYVVIIIVSYGILMIILSLLYLIFLYITNKNLQEGFEKSAHMKLDKVDEVIKKIESFNEKHLSKFRIKEIRSVENKESNNDLIISKDTPNPTGNEKYKHSNNDGKKFKNLNILSYSYLQILFLIVIIIGILIPLYSVSYSMITESNQILSIETFIFGKLVYASHSTVNIKCLIWECEITKPIEYSTDNSFLANTQVENIVRDLTNFPGFNDFYNNKFLLNACSVITNSTDPSYNTCMDDIIIKSANNTDSLLKLLEETVETIEKDRVIKTNKNIISNGKTVLFKNKNLFETEYYHRLESVFYKYITPISDQFEIVVNNSLQSYLDTKKLTIIIMVIVFAIVIMIFSIYIIFVFINKLIHLLSVSRCILKIIPTNVIIGTNELDSWLESKY